MFSGPDFYPGLGRALEPAESAGLVYRPCPDLRVGQEDTGRKSLQKKHLRFTTHFTGTAALNLPRVSG